MRITRRRLITITCAHTAVVRDQTGGVIRVETVQRFDFQGVLMPPKKRITRTRSGVRLAVTWCIIPQGKPDVRELDHLYIPGDSRPYLVTGIRDYPQHQEINMELVT